MSNLIQDAIAQLVNNLSQGVEPIVAYLRALLGLRIQRAGVLEDWDHRDLKEIIWRTCSDREVETFQDWANGYWDYTGYLSEGLPDSEVERLQRRCTEIENEKAMAALKAANETNQRYAL